jgi:hypothetical protein
VSNAQYLPHEIEKHFYGKQFCRLLRATERDRFLVAGVAQINLAVPDMVLAAQVVFLENSFAFPDELDEPEDVTAAFVTICRDDYGDAIDLAAWAPSTGRLSTWLGRAWAIDQFRLMRPRLAEVGALPVQKTPLEWLRAKRDGIVIIDSERAKWQIAYLGRSLIVEDVSHGRTLRHALTMPEPEIFVSPSSVATCAA